jgi:hypothetical protein
MSRFFFASQLLFFWAVSCSDSPDLFEDAGADTEKDAGADTETELEKDAGADTETELEEDAGADTETELEEDAGADTDLEEVFIRVKICLDPFFYITEATAPPPQFGCPLGYRCNTRSPLNRCVRIHPESTTPYYGGSLLTLIDGTVSGLCTDDGTCDSKAFAEVGDIWGCTLWQGVYGTTCIREDIWEKIYYYKE